MASDETRSSAHALSRAGLTPVRSSVGDRVWIALAAAVALAGVAARIHNIQFFDALMEPDGNGHALHVLAWYEGRLPDPRAWSGFHPPLYYMLGAALWHLSPDTIPVHDMLRLLSAIFGAASDSDANVYDSVVQAMRDELAKA